MTAFVVTVVLGMVAIGVATFVDDLPSRGWLLSGASVCAIAGVVAYRTIRRRLVPLMANEEGWYFLDRDGRDACWFVSWTECAEPGERAVPFAGEPGLMSSVLVLDVSVDAAAALPNPKWLRARRREDVVRFVLDGPFDTNTVVERMTELWRGSGGSRKSG